MKLPNKLAINTIYKNLPGLNQAQLDALNESISNSPQSVVKLDSKAITKSLTDRTFAVRLKKWVEPYFVGGINYSLFYTEVDHNYKVGEKVFIVGGEYDSDNLRENSIDPYYSGVDGYKVLYADRTKVVLDIEYTGVEPTNEEPIDVFVKIYTISTQYDFDYFMQTLSMRDDNGNLESKFQEGYNNFLYLNGTFTINSGNFNGLTGFLPSTSSGNGFYIRNSSNELEEITTDVLSNNIIPHINVDYDVPLSGFYNLLKMRVMNSRFRSGGTDFKTDHIYHFNTTQNKWMVDRSYMPTIITKSNFRGGLLAGGEFNQGLYGHYDERLDYNGENIKWSLGTTLNVNWKSGTLGSDHYKNDSNFTVFDRTGLPQVRANAENNGGAGYNYVFDTDFEGGDVINGNIFNLSTFYGTMSSVSALENYIDGTAITYSVTLSGGVYYNSDILFANIKNTTLISSRVVNSLVRDSKAVNSEIVSSAFINSLYLGDNVIKIQAYEESNIKWYDKNISLPTGVDYKMYKFYITDASFLRMRELQYFYLKDVIVNVGNQELLNFFDDKFQVGHWTQTYDEIGSKSERQVLVQLSTKEENRNSPGEITTETDLQPNFENTLPSIDVFISGGEDFNYGSTTSYPRTFISDTVDIKDAYILEGDFVSGLFKDSTWVSGNYINYNTDYSFNQNSDYYQGDATFGPRSIETSDQSIVVRTPISKRPDVIGTQSFESNIVFLNSVYYDSTQNVTNPGTNFVRLPDTYKVISYSSSLSNRDFTLRDVSTQSNIANWGYDVTNGNYFNSLEAQNKYNYLHPVKFENSEIRGGLFRRAYFDNCTFTNFDYNTQDKDLTDVIEKRNFLVSDVIFDDNSNTIESGMFQYSHFLSGSDNWKNGIFHRGIWSETTSTYSFSPTSSTIYTREPSKFSGGVFRESQWENGVFENGTFYNNRSNEAGVSDVLTGRISVYYTNTQETKWSWMNGVFENGDFEKSNFEKGIFEDGNLFNSSFLTGEALGGNFGRKNIPFKKSRVYTGTFSNMNVINAEFRTLDPTGLQGIQASIHWNSGVFNSGVFGVDISNGYTPSSYIRTNTWLDGRFDGGDFTDVAEWKDGIFNGGRFLSYYQYDGQTPYELSVATSASFSWQGGVFNNGEFGRGDVGENSTWYSGEFNGGKFEGRYWNDGIFTRGQFNGHAGSYSTSLNEYDGFINSFNSDYYGYWNDGFVSEVKDKFITNKKLWTEVERISTKKKKRPNVDFKNMYWASGTFSHTDGTIDNSIWRDGTFENGLFSNSSFNPYYNHTTPIFISGTQTTTGWNAFNVSLNTDGLYEYSSTINYTPFNGSVIQDNVLQVGKTYTLQIEITENSMVSGDIYTNDGVFVAGSGQVGIFNISFTPLTTEFMLTFSGLGNVLFKKLVVYPGTISGFNTDESCVWLNGEAYSSDIYYSKWYQGTFDSYATSSQGNAWGVIWKDGIVKYQNAYNVTWENGVWKNGNWFGSPFKQISTYSNVLSYPGFSSDILNNTSLYASQSLGLSDWDTLHMNDTFTGSFGVEQTKYGEFDGNTDGWDGTNWTPQTNYDLVYGNVIGDNISTTTDFAEVVINEGVSILNPPNGTADMFTETQQQYNIEIKYSGYVGVSYFSPPPVLKFRVDVGYVGSATTDDESSNGGIRRFITAELQSATSFLGFPIRFSTWYGGVLNYTYTPTNLDLSNSRKIKIQRLSHTGDSIGMELNIQSVSVIPYDVVYDDVTNNELWSVPSWTPNIGQDITLPNNIIYKIGDLTSLYGNGRFMAGIWENGVWNEGWRDDKTTLWSSDIFNFSGGKNFAFKTEKYKTAWNVRLNIIQNNQSPGSFSDFNVGDKVSIGNIIAIDINDNRRLLRDTMIITDKYEGYENDPFSLNNQILVQTITVQFETTFPIRSVERDSEEHIMMITKNIWLNGVFLNGKFLNGVWSNGLMQGFPYITEMINQHWVDGVLKGGRFQGLTSSYIDNLGNTPTVYNTGLIQKFIFSDENVSGIPFKFKFNSWVDVNYFRESGVNINRVNEVFNQTPLSFTSSYIENNHYGFPTKDVLESVSSLRNGHNLDIRKYKLGWKFKEYQEWIPQQEIQFNSINQYNWVNSSSSDQIIEIDNGSGYGLSNLEQSGWTFGYGSTDTFGDAVNSIVNNYGNLPINLQNKLIFSGGKQSPSIIGQELENYTLDFIDNTDIELEKLRYSFVEITGENLNPVGIGSELNPIVFFNNYPASYSVASKTFYYGNTQSFITIPVNQFATSSVVNQREYFYNKKGLEMTLLSGSDTNSGTFSMAFEKIRLVETDMIPFLNYTGGCSSINDEVDEVDEVVLPSWNEDGITISLESTSGEFSANNSWDVYFTEEQLNSSPDTLDGESIEFSALARDQYGSGYYKVWYTWCDPDYPENPNSGSIQFGTNGTYNLSNNTTYYINGSISTFQEGYDFWNTINSPSGGTQTFPNSPGYNQNVWAIFAYAVFPYDAINTIGTISGYSGYDQMVPIPGQQEAQTNACLASDSDPCEGVIQVIPSSSTGGGISGLAEPGDTLNIQTFTINNGGLLNPTDFVVTWIFPDGSTEISSLPGAPIETTVSGVYSVTMVNVETGCVWNNTFSVGNIVGCDLQVNLINEDGVINIEVIFNGQTVAAGNTNESLSFGASDLNSLVWSRTDGNLANNWDFTVPLGNQNDVYLSYPYSPSYDPIEPGQTFQVTVSIGNCVSTNTLTINPEAEPNNTNSLINRLYMPFAGYTQSYTSYQSDGNTGITTDNPIDPVSGVPRYLPYYENTDWSYTLRITFLEGTGWIFVHLPFSHPVDPGSAITFFGGDINQSIIIGIGPSNIDAMQSNLPEWNWQGQSNASWNGTIDSPSISGQDRDIVSVIIKTEPGNWTQAPLNVVVDDAGGVGYWDMQLLPLYLTDYATTPVAYTGFRKRNYSNDDNRLVVETTDYSVNPLGITQLDRLASNYSQKVAFEAIWLGEANNYPEELNWNIFLPFDNFLEVPGIESVSNYDLIRVTGDWSDLIGTQTYDIDVEAINTIPNSGEEDPTDVDSTIFYNDDDIICFNYINGDIQIPYVSKAPNIDYDNSNFDYLSSVSVWLPNININIPQITSTPQLTTQFITFPDDAANSN